VGLIRAREVHTLPWFKSVIRCTAHVQGMTPNLPIFTSPEVCKKLIMDHIVVGAPLFILDTEYYKEGQPSQPSEVTDWAMYDARHRLMYEGTDKESLHQTIIALQDQLLRIGILVKGAAKEAAILRSLGINPNLEFYGSIFTGIFDLDSFLRDSWVKETSTRRHRAIEGVTQIVKLMQQKLGRKNFMLFSDEKLRIKVDCAPSFHRPMVVVVNKSVYVSAPFSVPKSITTFHWLRRTNEPKVIDKLLVPPKVRFGECVLLMIEAMYWLGFTGYRAKDFPMVMCDYPVVGYLTRHFFLAYMQHRGYMPNEISEADRCFSAILKKTQGRITVEGMEDEEAEIKRRLEVNSLVALQPKKKEEESLVRWIWWAPPKFDIRNVKMMMKMVMEMAKKAGVIHVYGDDWYTITE